MDCIAVGCITAWLAQRTWKPALLRVLLGLGVGATLLVLVLRRTTAALGLYELGLDVTLLAVGIALILLALAGNVGQAALAARSGWLQWIGRHSYEIYLFHMFAVLWGVQLYRALQPAMHWIGVWYCAMLLSSLAIAAIIARCCSVPLNRVLRAWQPRPAAFDVAQRRVF